MQNNTYNGWTNYETWRVNLEIFDYTTANEFCSFSVYKPDCAYELSDELKDYAVTLLEMEGAKGLTFDYAMAFLEAVDFRQIAQRMIENAIEEHSHA
jgi:hypothetical protein